MADDAQKKVDPDPKTTNIKDELTEVVSLKHVNLLIGEYIPFGVNHIVAFNEKLGSYMRVKSALLTQVIDDDPGGSQFAIPSVLTEVQVKNFDRNDFVEFDATIHYPEAPGIVQVENFGVHVNSSGKILYGMQLESVGGRPADHVSIDHLSRVLADVVLDSSQLMDTMLTDYQRRLVDLTFFGKGENRDKYTFILAKGVAPDVPAKEYMDGEDRENELRQVLDTFQGVYDLLDGSKMLVGTHGSILISKDPGKYELVASEYSFLMSLDIFIQNFFSRLFMMNDSVKDIKKLIDTSEEDPNAIEKAQSELSNSTSDAVLLGEILSYLEESASVLSAEWAEFSKALDPAVKQAASVLTIEARVDAVKEQVKDMKHIVDGLLKSLEGLSRMNETINQRQMRRFQSTLEDNARTMEDMVKTSDRTSSGVAIMEMILSGTLVFELISMFSGDQTFPIAKQEGDLLSTMGWALTSVGIWAMGSALLFWVMKWLGDRSEPALVLRLKINQKFNPEALKAYLAKREVTTEDLDLTGGLARKKLMWKYNDNIFWEELPKWGKHKVVINLFYDEKTGYILNALVEVPMPGEMKLPEAKAAFLGELIEENVIAPPRE